MRNFRLAWSHGFQPRNKSRRLVAALVVLTFFSVNWASLALAESPTAATMPPQASAPAAAMPVAPADPPPTNPALDLRASAPKQPDPSVFKRWWFWTAVGAVAAATVAVIVISSRGNAPPTTDLGNQEFQP